MPKVTGSPDHYLPEFVGETYIPSGVEAFPWQTCHVFLPDASVVGTTVPLGGWPVLLATPFGGFASTLPTAQIDEPGVSPTTGELLLWGCLEAGIAVVSFGLMGSDAYEYAPGGPHHGGPVSIDSTPLGMATFDPAVSTTPGLDHWDDVGDSTDDGQSYPNEAYHSCQRDAVHFVQYVRERAAEWGINPKLACIYGRSSAAWAVAAPFLGPDRADPEFSDQRRHSTRVPLGILPAGSGWTDAFDQDASLSIATAFPDAGDPVSTIAATLAAAPSAHAREASYLRYGTRDFSAYGPKITGPELRALNGSSAAFYAYHSDGLGLVTSTPTDAMGFSGTDAANTRIPTLSDELTEVHPAIMGFLWRARWAEFDVEGFHAAHSRLVVTDAVAAQVTGHVDANGVALESYVDATKEGLEASVGSVAADMLAWLQSELRRLYALGLLEHPRQKVLDTLADALRDELSLPYTAGGKTYELEGRVFANRVRPTWGDALPAVLVYALEEDAEVYSDRGRIYNARATMLVEIQVDLDAADGRVDQLLSAISLHAREFLLARAFDLSPVDPFEFDYKGEKMVIRDEGSKQIAASVLRFEFAYRIDATEPKVAHPLQTLSVKFDLPSSTTEHEYEFELEA